VAATQIPGAVSRHAPFGSSLALSSSTASSTASESDVAAANAALLLPARDLLFPMGSDDFRTVSSGGRGAADESL
jgi:hypothetical protein